jgi:hypothetical protein
MSKASEYLGIRLWGKQLSSHEYYIKAQQEKAQEMSAPIDALYERDGSWVCVSDLKPEHDFRAKYDKYVKENSK